jgi:hypothetical protein
MASLTVNGYGFVPLSNICQGFGSFYLLEPFGKAPEYTPQIFEEEEVPFIGVTDTATKRLGPFKRYIFADICFAHFNEAGVEGLVNTAWTAFQQQNRYTITTPGGSSFPGCKYNSVSPLWTKNIHGWYVQAYQCSFKQLGTSN